MPVLYSFLLLALLAGCSSFQADPDQLRAIPAERLLAYQNELPESGEVVVTRDLGLLGGGCYVAVEVDRQLAARIGVGEQGRFQVPPGTRVVGIAIDTQDDTLCGKGRLQREVAVKVVAGQRAELRIVSQNRGGFDIWPIASQ